MLNIKLLIVIHVTNTMPASGHKRDGKFNRDFLNVFLLTTYAPTTVGSRSINTALGTCFPAPVSLKKVLKESSPPPIVLSLGI